jgi:hypothetical protein
MFCGMKNLGLILKLSLHTHHSKLRFERHQLLHMSTRVFLLSFFNNIIEIDIMPMNKQMIKIHTHFCVAPVVLLRGEGIFGKKIIMQCNETSQTLESV